MLGDISRLTRQLSEIKLPTNDESSHETLEKRTQEAQARFLELETQFKAARAAWEQSKEERDDFRKSIDESKSDKKQTRDRLTKVNDEITALIAKRDGLRADKDELLKKNRELKESANERYKVQRAIDDLTRDIANLERKKRDPIAPVFVKEKDCALMIIKTLKQKLEAANAGKAASSSDAKSASVIPEKGADSNLPKGVKSTTILKKGAMLEGDDFFSAMSGGSKQKSKSAGSSASAPTAETPIKFDFAFMSACGVVNVPVPLKYGDIEATIAATQAKYDGYLAETKNLEGKTR